MPVIQNPQFKKNSATQIGLRDPDVTQLKVNSGDFDVLDTNGNELLTLSTTASAVNEIKITNNATGSGPIIEATGGDNDIDLNLQTDWSLGKGNISFQADKTVAPVIGSILTFSPDLSWNNSLSFLSAYQVGGRDIVTVATWTMDADVNPAFGGSQLFFYNPTIQTPSGTNRASVGSHYIFFNNPLFKGNNANMDFSTGSVIALRDIPRFQNVTSGTMSDIDIYTAYSSPTTVGTVGTITIDNFYGLWQKPTLSSVGTITDRYGVFLADKSGAGTQTNFTGLYIADQTVGTAKYSVRSLGEDVFMRHVGDIMIGNDSDPDAKLEIQTGTTEGKQAVTIDQNDTDQPFIDFQGSTGADTTSTISTNTTSGSTTHHLQIEINGTKAWIAASTNNPS